ncbi:MAG: hypothetical protein HXX13_16720, partial [Bacteroidetes bacterium]|nr:hypothetical protein [Bacteroidota bacterium]
TICSGTSVTFTAVPTNGGSTPSYQWKLNGNSVGSNSTTYTNSSLANNDIVTCVLTSNATCATGSPATSNAVTMTVNPNLPASVIIAASATTICSGTSVTFTATPTNGGTSPTYQWKLNGSNVGTSGATYSAASLANNDVVTCVMTSNATCATGSPATSNSVTMTVNPNLPASVSISASSNPVCSGTSVTFTATPTNGGASPTYQWKLNGTNVGTSSTTYTNASVVNNDVVTCVLTSNAVCATGSPATSNSVTLTVNPNLPASVSISATATTICSGTSVTFTATPTNGGTTPGYQWKLNGSNVGTNSPTYTNAALANGNTISCVMTSNATCATGSPATSNTATMTVNPNLPVSLSIAASSNPVCSGSSVTFTATPTNGGSSPVYQWKRNGTNVGTSSPTYSSSSLTNNDIISCILTSNATCATSNPATSNSITLAVTALPTASISYSGSPYCYNSGTYAVTFSGTSGGTYTASPTGLSINSSTGAINTAASTPGTYTITYSIAASGGCTEVTTSQSVTINPLPTASISGTTAVCLNATSPSITFTGAGSTAPYTFAYTMNGGATQYVTTTSGNSITVSVPTGTAGTFVYSLVSVTGSTNCYQSQTGTATVTVRPDLVINDDAPASLCQYNIQMVTATPSGGSGSYTYSWQVTTSGASGLFVPGSTTNNFIWLTSYSLAPGTYNYQLIVTDGNWGCSKVKNYSVTILSNLNPTWVLNPSTACVGQIGAVYSVPTLSATTYTWAVTGGTIASGQGTSQISVNWGASAGTGTVTLNTATGTCTQFLNQSVSIYALPTITLGANPSVCSGVTAANLTYSATTGSPNRYSIDFNAAANSAGFIDVTDASLSGSPIVIAVPGGAAAGTYSGSLTVRSTIYGCNSNVYSISVTINPNLPVSIAVSPSSNPVCSGTSVTFSATPTNGGSSPSYQWKLNGSNVGTSATTYSSASLANNDVISCVLTSNATCATGSPATSNSVTMTVNPNLPASVSVTASSTIICSGTVVSFTATPANGGTTPAYQWKVNGTNAGGNSPSYSNGSLANNDVVTCVMTSNATCATGNPATSNSVTMTVNPNLPVSVSISASATTICSGTSVTFTASPVNGGSTPTYQWLLNGSNVGTNSSTYTNSSLSNNDIVRCQLTSNATCATGSPAMSNQVAMTVNSNLPVSVSISATATTICQGLSVTFTATPTNGGTIPSYQWKLNGTNVGTNSNTYSTTSLANNDVVSCVLTSNASCIAGNPATSNLITITVNPNLPVSVSIAASASTICSGSSVTFTATPANGGSTPAYQWLLNGANVGSSSATYTTSSLANGDAVTCILTSSIGCSTGNPATSNSLITTVNPNLPVSVSIAASSNPICSGSSVTFTATPVNSGSAPIYQWKVNGSNVGSSSATYTSTTLANNEVVTCQLTSNATCATGSPATSNSITMSVNPVLTASIIISASSNPICSGSSVTFTAVPTNGGSSPSYQWKLNGTNVGSNSTTYTNATLVNGDLISCVMTSNAGCVSGSPATSNTITMVVNPNLPVSVTISASPSNTICSGTSVTFTATPVNGGSSPSYQWKKNGGNVGSNSSTYTDAALVNSDLITCVLASNLTCVSGNPATSNQVKMVVNLTPTIPTAISASPSSIYSSYSGQITLTASGGGGTGSVLKWYAGGCGSGSSIGTGSPLTINAPIATTTYYARWENGTCVSGCLSAAVTVYSNYRSKATGDWSSASTWEVYSNGSWVAASASPTALDGTITIQSPHTVTISSTGGYVNVDELTINSGGKLTVNVCPSNWWLSIVDGPGTDLTINGTMEYQDDKVNLATGATMVVGSGGKFQHNLNYAGNYPITVPTASWDVNSTYEVLSSNQAVPSAGLNQTFGNFTWNYTGQTADINLAGALSNITGNFTISSTGANKLILTNSNSLTLAIGKDLIIQGGTLDFSSAVATTKVINLSGNYNQTGGTFTNSNSNVLTVNFKGIGTTFTQSAGILTSTYFNWDVNSTASLTLNNNLPVASGRSCTLNGTLDCGINKTVIGAGSFVMASAARLIMGSSDGITTSSGLGNIQTTSTNFTTNGDFVYNGSGAQVTGNRLPSTVRNLTISNTSGATLTSSVTVNNQLTLSSGNFSIGSNTLTFQNADVPIVTSGGKLNPISTSNFAFGTAGNTAGAAYVLPDDIFTSNPQINNFTIYRTNSLTLNNQTLNVKGVVLCNGPLATNGKLKLLSTAVQTALIDGTGTGNITGNVTMQRYVPSAFGYKYFSSPFQFATVAAFSPYLNLQASFPTFYKYDENRQSSGWVSYVDPAGQLTPLQGYAANFGTSGVSKTVEMTGLVNNNITNPVTFYNHNYTYTKGYNLVGNLYPSPIDWNASTGWTKNNIDNAIYYFDAGNSDQYTGTYSTYINGVSSDGIANNIIPSMQGFFIHVTNGSYPVSASFGMDNRVRVNNLSPAFHKSLEDDFKPMVRLSASYSDDAIRQDHAVVYFDDRASMNFNSELDALKLMNTDEKFPNLFAINSDLQRLSIKAIPTFIDSLEVIPLGITTEREGWTNFDASSVESLPVGLRVFLVDSTTGVIQDLQNENNYHVYLGKGEETNRFSLVFSYKDLQHSPSSEELFNVYYYNQALHIYMDLSLGTKSKLVVSNMLGQRVMEKQLNGNGYHEIKFEAPPGIYEIDLYTPTRVHSRKINKLN